MKNVSRGEKYGAVGRMACAGILACMGACIAVACSGYGLEDTLQSPTSPSQAQIIAAFVFNFAKFTEWPQQAFTESNAPLNVCFLGGEDVRVAFQEISAGKSVNARPILVRDVKTAGEVLDCRIIYIDTANGPVVAGVMKNARQRCALVIGVSNDFLLRGGIIKLLVENNRMKFDVNVGAADRTKIRLSSKLLALARSVVDLPDPAGN
jgi:hypothetical protein